MTSYKLTKYDSDNILGWTEEDFADVICDMANLQIANDIRLHPVIAKVYLDESQEWYKRRLNRGTDKMILAKKITKLNNGIEIVESVIFEKRKDKEKYFYCANMYNGKYIIGSNDSEIITKQKAEELVSRLNKKVMQ